jgi:hypothetical protein
MPSPLLNRRTPQPDLETMKNPEPLKRSETMSTKLRATLGLAIGLLLLVSLAAPVQARAASPALDGQIIAGAYV